jgi:hypothetical protein
MRAHRPMGRFSPLGATRKAAAAQRAAAHTAQPDAVRLSSSRRDSQAEADAMATSTRTSPVPPFHARQVEAVPRPPVIFFPFPRPLFACVDPRLWPGRRRAPAFAAVTPHPERPPRTDSGVKRTPAPRSDTAAWKKKTATATRVGEAHLFKT